MSDMIFSWPMSSWFGWGIRGLNTAFYWPGTAISALGDQGAELGPDDPRQPLLKERLKQSEQHQAYLAQCEPSIRIRGVPVLCALPNNLARGPAAHGRWVDGEPTIGCAVFEDVAAVKENVERLKHYDRVVVASRWNQDVLSDLGVEAALIHEGIDPVLFNPSVKQKRHDGRFRVFSGGKVEWRKGQDLVIKVFKLFADKHNDAVLVASWGSPFAMTGTDFEGKWEYGSPPGINIGRPNYAAWLQKAGLKRDQYEIVEPRPNWAMPEVYGSCDVAVFPNRCEGGTNFVAMECMASGVPTIIRTEYGQDDLPTRASVRGTDAQVLGATVDALGVLYGNSLNDGDRMNAYWHWDRHCREMAELIASV